MPPAEVADKLKPYATGSGKPLLASWMGGASVAAADSILNGSGIPTFSYPDTAARAFTYMWRYSDNLRTLYETPSLTEGPGPSEKARENVQRLIDTARSSGRSFTRTPIS